MNVRVFVTFLKYVIRTLSIWIDDLYKIWGKNDRLAVHFGWICRFYRGDSLVHRRDDPNCPPSPVEFELPQADSVSINVFDIKGDLVEQLFAGALSPGWHRCFVVTADMSSGVYFVQVKGKTEILRKKILVLK